MTAIEEMEALIREPDLEKREIAFEKWTKRWLGQLELARIVPAEDLAGKKGPEADALLHSMIHDMRKTLAAGVVGRPECMFSMVRPVPDEPGAMRYSLAMTVLLRVPADEPRDRPRIVRPT